MSARPSVCDFGWKAPEFTLPATDGNNYSLNDISGENGTLVVFMCNHCPYVLAILDRLKQDAKNLQAFGVNVVAICSNDAISHPDDSFPKMQDFARDHGLNFVYLHDESQAVARAYDAVCTPDFFGLNANGELQYRGRLDESGAKPARPDAKRELFEAMKLIAETGSGPKEQTSSMGCSIKWKSS
ncbi:MAG: thioredoxin family protein [Paracoccaceae bacterium]